MSNKHTPGPWFAEDLTEGTDQEFIGVSSDNVNNIADVWAIDTTQEQCQASARLIAAAPELLDELIEQDKFLGVLAGTVPLSEKDTHRRIAMHRESVRAAITKATGE